MKSFITSLDFPKESRVNFLAVTRTCTFRIQRHVITCSTTTHAFGFPWEAYSATYCIYYIPTIDAVNSVFSTTKSTLLWMDDKASSACLNIDPGIQKAWRTSVSHLIALQDNPYTGSLIHAQVHGKPTVFLIQRS